MTRIALITQTQNALAAAQSAVAAAQLVLAEAQAVPLDKFISTADGLSAFVESDGTVKLKYNVVIAGWPASFGQSSSLLSAIGAQPFPQSRGPAAVAIDSLGRLQFVSDGIEYIPNPLTLFVSFIPDDSPIVQSEVVLNWEPAP